MLSIPINVFLKGSLVAPQIPTQPASQPPSQLVSVAGAVLTQSRFSVGPTHRRSHTQLRTDRRARRTRILRFFFTFFRLGALEEADFEESSGESTRVNPQKLFELSAV